MTQVFGKRVQIANKKLKKHQVKLIITQFNL